MSKCLRDATSSDVCLDGAYSILGSLLLSELMMKVSHRCPPPTPFLGINCYGDAKLEDPGVPTLLTNWNIGPVLGIKFGLIGMVCLRVGFSAGSCLCTILWLPLSLPLPLILLRIYVRWVGPFFFSSYPNSCTNFSLTEYMTCSPPAALAFEGSTVRYTTVLTTPRCNLLMLGQLCWTSLAFFDDLVS